MRSDRLSICFVTGTRAEFGLMRTTLDAIRSHLALRLQIVATGMHLDPRHGATLRTLRQDGFAPDAVVPWPSSSGRSPDANAINTGNAVAGLAAAFRKLDSRLVLVVGDRVEAFAAATAAHLSHRLVAHVHGGDRAIGQIDDSLRHAITKLAHIHLPATPASAARIARLGEDKWRIHCVGSPGNDGIARLAAPHEELLRRLPGLSRRGFALLLLHPVDADPALEESRARLVLDVLRESPVPRIVIVRPNNDPGCAGTLRAWRSAAGDPRLTVLADAPRPLFLALLRDAAMLVGNSSAGIIEAASFGVPVLDIGPRQAGRECPPNVTRSPYRAADIRRWVTRIWNGGKPLRRPCRSAYARSGAGRRIARILARLASDPRLPRKLIVY